MAARSVWKGSIKFSLVQIPCKLFNATESTKSIGFHQLHNECQGRINQQIYCPQCEKTVERSTLLKGYEYVPGQHVILTEAEIEEAEKAKSDTIDIVSFVDGKEIPPIYYSDSMFISPDKVGAELFVLFKSAMVTTSKVAVGKVTMRSKENLILIQPYEEILIGYVLYYQEQIRAASEIPGANLKADKFKLDPALLDMAVKLVESLSIPFNPADYKDEYKAMIMAAIERKINPLAAPAPVVEKPQPTNVVNLADLLANALALSKAA